MRMVRRSGRECAAGVRNARWSAWGALAACACMGLSPAARAQCGAGCASGTCAISNGDFELGSFANWTTGGNFTGTAVYATTFDNVAVHGGTYASYWGAIGTDATISQTITANAGDQVLIDFWYADNGGSADHFLCSFDGQTLVEFTNDTAHTAWTEMTFPVTVMNTNPVLMFSSHNNPAYDYIDDVSVCVTPGGNGACCAANGTCTISTPSSPCVGGVFGGVDSACSGAGGGCPVAAGACCNSLTGACAYVAGSGACGGAGVYSGDHTVCSPNTCASGACCNDGTSACTAGGSVCPAGSTYQGPGTSCSPVECPNASCGAACDPGAVCSSINGGFETGDFSGWMQFGDTSFTAVETGFDGFVPHGGTYEAHFGPTTGVGGIMQTIPAHAGDQVTIGFWYGVVANATPNSFDCTFDGNSLVSFTNDTANTDLDTVHVPGHGRARTSPDPRVHLHQSARLRLP